MKNENLDRQSFISTRNNQKLIPNKIFLEVQKLLKLQRLADFFGEQHLTERPYFQGQLHAC